MNATRDDQLLRTGSLWLTQCSIQLLDLSTLPLRGKRQAELRYSSDAVASQVLAMSTAGLDGITPLQPVIILAVMKRESYLQWTSFLNAVSFNSAIPLWNLPNMQQVFLHGIKKT